MHEFIAGQEILGTFLDQRAARSLNRHAVPHFLAQVSLRAKRSNLVQARARLWPRDCFVALLLAMTARVEQTIFKYTQRSATLEVGFRQRPRRYVDRHGRRGVVRRRPAPLEQRQNRAREADDTVDQRW